MNQYERRFYEDFHRLVIIQEKILKQLEKMNESLKEDEELKKQLSSNTLQLENQQQEFIEYLEDLIKQNETVVEVSKYGLPKNCSKLLIDFYKYILSKYKEIIGVKNEKNIIANYFGTKGGE